MLPHGLPMVPWGSPSCPPGSPRRSSEGLPGVPPGILRSSPRGPPRVPQVLLGIPRKADRTPYWVHNLMMTPPYWCPNP